MTSDDMTDTGDAITISGTRTITDIAPTRIERLFDDLLAPFATPAAHFLIGGAVGIDTVALRWIAERTGSALSVVVPCTVADQPRPAADEIERWRQEDRTRVIELGASRIGSAAYHARNRWMVDRSRLVLAFPLDPEPKGGTWYTADYARSRGTPFLVAPLRKRS